MSNNGLIIGTFVKKTKILSFLEFLKNKLKVNIHKTFVFDVEKNDTEYLVTFSSIKTNPYFTQLHDATILHVKNGCLFSINALNMYIDSHTKGENVNHKDYMVDWDNLKDTLLITTNGLLKQSKLFKIRDKCRLIEK